MWPRWCTPVPSSTPHPNQSYLVIKTFSQFVMQYLASYSVPCAVFNSSPSVRNAEKFSIIESVPEMYCTNKPPICSQDTNNFISYISERYLFSRTFKTTNIWHTHCQPKLTEYSKDKVRHQQGCNGILHGADPLKLWQERLAGSLMPPGFLLFWLLLAEHGEKYAISGHRKKV